MRIKYEEAESEKKENVIMMMRDIPLGAVFNGSLKGITARGLLIEPSVYLRGNGGISDLQNPYRFWDPMDSVIIYGYEKLDAELVVHSEAKSRKSEYSLDARTHIECLGNFPRRKRGWYENRIFATDDGY